MKWIKVKEQLPSEGVLVDIFMKSGVRHRDGYYYPLNEQFKFFDGVVKHRSYVSHWIHIELPEIDHS